MKLVLATGNHHKRDELSKILDSHILETPDMLGINFSCEETGETYYQNALLKAEMLYSLTGKPVLADDSGLSVNALDGAPGIYSARFGMDEFSKKISTEDQNLLLLEKIANSNDRGAQFVCCMVLILDNYRIYSVQETLKGTITEKPKGDQGFGYDPVFCPDGYNATLAELGSTVKNRISHRAKAGKAIGNILNNMEQE